ncbi:MAG: NadS family protein [Gammaproteobacteria bacterium]|nr:MAG: NadS family protein [Gammaproteobacteria bacterium]
MKKQLFSDLVTSVRQAGEISRGTRRPSRAFRFSTSRVKAIREATQLSQSEFALLLGVSVKTLQNWEQARRRPRGPAAALLRIVEHEPELALRALHQ